MFQRIGHRSLPGFQQHFIQPNDQHDKDNYRQYPQNQRPALSILSFGNHSVSNGKQQIKPEDKISCFKEIRKFFPQKGNISVAKYGQQIIQRQHPRANLPDDDHHKNEGGSSDNSRTHYIGFIPFDRHKIQTERTVFLLLRPVESFFDGNIQRSGHQILNKFVNKNAGEKGNIKSTGSAAFVFGQQVHHAKKMLMHPSFRHHQGNKNGDQHQPGSQQAEIVHSLIITGFGEWVIGYQ